MGMVEVKAEPTRQDLRVLGLALVAFAAVVAALARWSPSTLLGAAVFTGVCAMAAAALDRESTAKEKAWGLLLPVLFIGAWAGERWLGSGPVIFAAGALGAAGAAGALSPGGPGVYRAWMRGAMPMGWVVSHVLLGVVFYGVITPIGLLLRLMGRDLLGLKFDRGAASYWRVRGPGEGTGRYFRQW